MYRNSGQARRARVNSIITQEFHLFPPFTAWRDYPSPAVGSFLFAAFWMCFAGGIDSFRTAADLAGTAIFAFTGGLVRHWNAADRLALAVFAPLGAEQALRWGAQS